MKRTALKRKTELRRRGSPKRSQPKRDWSAARTKVEHAACRLCAPDENCGPVEAAHVIGRECDRVEGPCRCGHPIEDHDAELGMCDHYDMGGGPCCLNYRPAKALYVHADAVIPLGSGHHKQYDAHEVDVLPVLTLEEQVRAVEDAGGIELARQRTAPLAYRTERVEGS